MAWAVVDFEGNEAICSQEPIFDGDLLIIGNYDCVDVPKGTIKKIIGRELTFTDGPVELKDE